MSGIFINYRVDDDASAAALVDERLRQEFGGGKVFRDSRSLVPGRDFDPELWRQLKMSTVLLALIGPRWLTLGDATGKRRLDHPHDYVRREIRHALKRDMVVIPLLLNDTPMPRAAELPPDIRQFSRRQFMELRVRNATVDLNGLVAQLALEVPRLGAPPQNGAKRRWLEQPAAGGIDARHTAVTLHGDGHNICGDIIGGDKYA
ncbi:toll/interleukin-1 receptor domain-containing protein [Micromonospora sp. NPDC049301]|uniref:toll/interleukin-1 receptor domain-containing protein n=1 Tax=Micromonospora sp. NPDC049301 TaxID=3155723 RepID=UPI00342583C6